jgi:hypothetical protein
MDTTTASLWTLVVILALAAVLLAGVAAVRRARARRADLRGQFGPEYDRAVMYYGNVAKAERELARRARRVRHFRFRELSDGDRARFATRWDAIQTRFVDDPQAAVARANLLIDDVMSARGYPSQDFEQRVADLSVHHAAVVQHYRAAHALVVPKGTGPTTEELRQAVVHYHALFAELLAPATAAERRTLRHSHA